MQQKFLAGVRSLYVLVPPLSGVNNKVRVGAASVYAYAHLCMHTPTPSYTQLTVPCYNFIFTQTSSTWHRIRPMRSGEPPERAAAKPLVKYFHWVWYPVGVVVYCVPPSTPDDKVQLAGAPTEV